ncbi:MAG: DUF4321 domain-containing protein [Clostridia bacterium]|nr:DUF4321 domain-containing protein [Clostridia bacterium]MBR3152197.1 DUF4321 domain-containing protein [Clostridia bacterium]MBR3152266.1 DUF4321 domain-containing protein [Clostridia bacterium]
MLSKDKNIWVLLIFILAGIVIGGLLATYATEVSWLKWLAYGEDFGLQNPVQLDLKVLSLTLGFWIKINVASIIGIILAIFIYRKI